MGNITIHFDGICTHVNQDAPQFEMMPRHRVVLVHAEQGRVIAGQSIPPHVPTLEVPFEDVSAPLDFASTARLGGSLIWKLEGTRLRIGNAVPGEVAYDPSYWQLMPRLRPHMDDPKLSRGVVDGTDAAAHFDIDSGSFGAETIHYGACRAILTMETIDEPVLVIAPIGGGPEQTLHISSGATITVANTGDKSTKESQYDFYLHYLIGETIPPRPFHPPANPPGNPGNPGDLLGPGCSNSNYP